MFASLKHVVMFAPTSTTAAATTTGLVDRKGYNWCQISILSTTQNVVSNRPTVLALTECDTSNGTFVAIPKFTGGTATSATVGFVIASPPDTSNNTETVFNVDCRGRKRWLKLAVSPLTTQVIGADAILSRPEQSVPVSAPLLQSIEG